MFVSALHRFYNLKYFDLEELWFVSRTFFPIHRLPDYLDSDLV